MNVPSGWKRLLLDDVLVSSEYGSSKPATEQGKRPIVGMKNLQAGRVLLHDLAFVEDDEKLAHLQLRVGDLLLNRTNSPDLVGKIAIVAEETEAIFASYLVRLNVDKRTIDPHYLNYWLNGSQAQRVIKRTATRGVSQANINPSVLKRQCPVLVPPLPEQRKIAEILRTWDDAIGKVDSLRRIRLATVEAEQLRMLFPDTSDEVDRKGQESWIRVPLGDAFTERSESGFESGTLLSISQVAGVVAQDSVGRKDTSNGSRSKYKRVVPGDIAYNTMRMWQGAAGLSSLEGLVSPAYTVVSPVLELIEPKFAAQLFKMKKMMFLFQRHSQGLTSDTWNLKYPAFSKIEIELPALEEQRRISAYLDTVRMEISLLEKQRFALEIQKRGLMQQLLTGKLRVNVEEGEAASV